MRFLKPVTQVVGLVSACQVRMATKAIAIVAGILVVTAVASPARGAIVVTIDDRSDTISATVEGLAADKFTITRPVRFDPESIAIRLIGVLSAPATANTLDEFQLKEADGSISDVVGFLTVRGSSDYSILFLSDSGEMPIPRETPANVYGTAMELGSFQTFKLNPTLRGELPLPPGAPDIMVRVASDVESVPEPMTVTLLAAGCCGMAAYASLRRLASADKTRKRTGGTATDGDRAA